MLLAPKPRKTDIFFRKRWHNACTIYHLWWPRKTFCSELHLRFPAAMGMFSLFIFFLLNLPLHFPQTLPAPSGGTHTNANSVVTSVFAALFLISFFFFFSYSSQSVVISSSQRCTLSPESCLFEENQKKPLMMNGLWQIMWFKTAFGVQGTNLCRSIQPLRAICALQHSGRQPMTSGHPERGWLSLHICIKS